MSQELSKLFWIGDNYCGLYRIGSGGIGEVWIGKGIGDHGFEKVVAIKRVLRDKRLRESHQRSITDEANLLSHLSASPNIVTIETLRVENGQPYLIMEYIDGSELRDILDEVDGPLPFPIATYIVNEISKGLSFAHHFSHPKTGTPLKKNHRDISL